MEELFRKYLNNELSASEMVELRAWLSEHPEELVALNKLDSFENLSIEELDKARTEVWDDFRHRVQLENQETVLKPSLESTNSSYSWYVKVAAILVVSFATVFAVYKAMDKPVVKKELVAQTTRTTDAGQKSTIQLSDGTIITVNSSSSIKYPEKFTGNKRVVELEGEAFFEVAHNPHKPFYVKFKDSEVRVLGTSFNIRTYDEESEVSVAVATGRVAFTSSEEKTKVVLEANEMVTYNESSKHMIKKPFDPKDMYGWKDKILYFKNEEFKDIVRDLEMWYGVKIHYTKDFSVKGTFTGEYKNKSLDAVLKGLSFLYEFKYEIDGDTVQLR
ncbi:FecR family protein [Marinoscillum pacificum]|uniref:FecR family protein n=1 Tax=Marinoscillum pacificum TaxID=392723 RepID=UPI00215782D6|nr:FecR family protein [Marinoscillum pacificum]